MIIPIVFLVVGIATLPDYGINWDEPKHFGRGQAYLHYVLTGHRNYLNIPQYPLLKGTFDSNLEYEVPKSIIPPDESYRRSYYQSDVYTLDFLLKNEKNIPDLHGHPEGNDFMAAVFNRIFYQKLNLLGDIESYHLFEVFVSFLLLVGIAYFVYKHLGIFPSFISTASLALYPLFFAESHFNIKDPPEAAFFGLTIIFFYFGMVNKNKVLIIISAVLAGLAFVTKLNAIFIIPILLSWMFLYKKLDKGTVAVLLLCPVIAFIVFFLMWPLLWFSPVEVLTNMVKFYRNIGLGAISGWNAYPIVWIVYTTPIPIIILSLIGVGHSLINIRKLNGFYFIVLFWIFLTILRVSLPGTSIYGGVRQIMEFIPALAVLTGIGSYALISHSKRFLSAFSKGTIVVAMFFMLWENVNIHPNQNVYFNQLAGGLWGAREKNVPSWGNSYGNAYMQGVNWINENAEPNAKLAVAVGNMINIPRIKLREDIDFSNKHWSGHLREGEYVIELYFNWDPRELYAYSYYDTFLNPVYQVIIDKVPILKIWKNDLAHTKDDYKSVVIYSPKNIKGEDESKIILDMGKVLNITKVEIKYSNVYCKMHTDGYIALSNDEENWIMLPERISGNQMRIDPVKFGIGDKLFNYFIAAREARYIMIDTLDFDSCLLKNSDIKIFGLKRSI